MPDSENSNAERIERTGARTFVVEHDDGSRFEMDWKKGVPQKKVEEVHRSILTKRPAGSDPNRLVVSSDIISGGLKNSEWVWVWGNRLHTKKMLIKRSLLTPDHELVG